jgi:hypothetical protein
MMADESSWEGSGQEERRRKRRYQVAMRAYFRWQEPDGTWRKGSGTTQNISSQGVFIVADSVPPLGDIKLAVAVPPVRRNATGKVRLCGQGVVLRVVPNSGFATHVALRLSNFPDNGDSNQM